MNPYLKGEKINLRRVRKPDANSIYKYVKDKEIARYTFIPHPYLHSDAYTFIRFCHRKIREKTEFHLGMEDNKTHQIIGMIGLFKINYTSQTAEVGYWLGKKYWGNGITIEAVRLMLHFAFDELKLHRVDALVMHPNIASANLLEKAGFIYEGRKREDVLQGNQRYDFLIYGILAKEYRKLYEVGQKK
jgi:RimJ/RimL family protein N-acetyltransferase